MAIKTNTAEGGTNSTTVTTGNSGGSSGDAFSSVSASVTFATAAALHGSLGYTASAASNQYTAWTTTDAVVLLRTYFSTSDLTNGGTPLRLALSSSSVSLSILSGGAVGRIQLYFGSSRGTSPSAISINTTYRAEMLVDSTSGALRAAIYVGDSTTAWWDSGSVTGLSIATPANAIYGKFDTAAYTMKWDDLGLKTLTDAVWGAWPSSNVAPVITSITGNQSVAASTTANASVTATDSDGTIASYAWTVDHCTTTSPTLTGGSTANVSFTTPAAGHIVILKCIVTDNGGLTATAFTEVRVPKTGTLTVLPDDGGKGYTVQHIDSWTLLGSATDQSAALRDSDTTTGTQSPTVTSTGKEDRYRLEPGGARTSLDITFGGVDKSDSGACSGSVNVYDGAALISSQTLGTITTSQVDKLITVDTSGLTNTDNIWVELVATN